ncbi:hypothetical protein [Streptomyces sp. I8-5]|uniref:hypothetical protein n=1 Tax=Streptomyces sp. I8-5 TaxID=3104277 RepID=UPI00386E72EA
MTRRPVIFDPANGWRVDRIPSTTFEQYTGLPGIDTTERFRLPLMVFYNGHLRSPDTGLWLSRPEADGLHDELCVALGTCCTIHHTGTAAL